MGQNQSGLVDLLDDVGHGKGFARTGNTHQGLFLVAIKQALGQSFNGLGLVTGGPVAAFQFKMIHGFLPFPWWLPVYSTLIKNVCQPHFRAMNICSNFTLSKGCCQAAQS